MSPPRIHPQLVWTANAQGQLTSEAQRLLRDLIAAAERVTGPFLLPSYTVATVPDAADTIGGTIYVSNEAGGATLAFSDGTNWRRVQDRAVIS
jgi:hypothetical protein